VNYPRFIIYTTHLCSSVSELPKVYYLYYTIMFISQWTTLGLLSILQNCVYQSVNYSGIIIYTTQLCSSVSELLRDYYLYYSIVLISQWTTPGSLSLQRDSVHQSVNYSGIIIYTTQLCLSVSELPRVYYLYYTIMFISRWTTPGLLFILHNYVHQSFNYPGFIIYTKQLCSSVSELPRVNYLYYTIMFISQWTTPGLLSKLHNYVHQSVNYPGIII